MCVLHFKRNKDTFVFSVLGLIELEGFLFVRILANQVQTFEGKYTALLDLERDIDPAMKLLPGMYFAFPL